MKNKYRLLSLANSFMLLAIFSSNAQTQFEEKVISLEQKPWGPLIWKNEVPEKPPVEYSKELVAVEFTGRNVNYTSADTWYPAWADNDTLYSPFTDGVSNIWEIVRSGGEGAVTGNAAIAGSNPMSLDITVLCAYPGDPRPYGGRYPCGSLVYNGVWYYGSYCLDDYPKGYNWGTMGPFVGFRISKDYGKSWIDTPCTPTNSLFKESGKDGNVVKLGAPHFVDFGKNMQYSPDEKAYLVGHGAVKEDSKPRLANNSWISGDQIYLTRVKPSVNTINDESAYEYFAGFKRGKAVWSSNFEDIRPIFEWNNHCGCVTMTYNPQLKKYIMCITDGWPTIKFMNSYFLESDQIEGPWKLITYMKNFGEQGYFLNIPSKFISQNDNKMWLCYSGNFAPFTDLGTNPPGGRYGMVLQEIRFLNKKEFKNYPYEKNENDLARKVDQWTANNPLTSSKNLALKAKVSVSSVFEGYDPNAVKDGVAKGFPLSPKNEWASKEQTRGSWVRLTWDDEIEVKRIWLFDRPTHNEHILSGGIRMSDGTLVPVGEIPNVEEKGLEITLDTPRKVKWIEFVVTGVGRCKSSGLSEFAVFAE